MQIVSYQNDWYGVILCFFSFALRMRDCSVENVRMNFLRHWSLNTKFLFYTLIIIIYQWRENIYIFLISLNRRKNDSNYSFPFTSFIIIIVTQLHDPNFAWCCWCYLICSLRKKVVNGIKIKIWRTLFWKERFAHVWEMMFDGKNKKRINIFFRFHLLPPAVTAGAGASACGGWFCCFSTAIFVVPFSCWLPWFWFRWLKLRWLRKLFPPR